MSGTDGVGTKLKVRWKSTAKKEKQHRRENILSENSSCFVKIPIGLSKKGMESGITLLQAKELNTCKYPEVDMMPILRM